MGQGHAAIHHRHAGSRPESLDHLAFSATLHCLLGCAVGEVADLVIGTHLGWGNAATIALAVALAFVSGFALTALSLLRRGLPLRWALQIALAADAASITIMEIVDNVLMLSMPAAMSAPISSVFFGGGMAVSLAAAGRVAYPVNRWLISRGKGHAVAHAHH